MVTPRPQEVITGNVRLNFACIKLKKQNKTYLGDQQAAGDAF